MVFVTVGTHEQPFPRMMQYASSLAEAGFEVCVQYGYNDGVPPGCHGEQLFPFREMERLLRQAEAVLTHGGTGSIMSALQAGHKPLVVPRLARLGEHVDDHQCQITEALAAEGLITPVSPETPREVVLDAVRNSRRRDSEQRPSQLAEYLKRKLERMEEPPVILFDGVCNLCNASVNFIIARDPEAHFRFAPLRSEAGEACLQRFDMAEEPPDSIVLIEDDQVFTASSAALRIAGKLKGPVRFLRPLTVIPGPFRDAVYRLVARNRYRWFGKREQCRIPGPGDRERFIETDEP